jgi:hypothetical protein
MLVGANAFGATPASTVAGGFGTNTFNFGGTGTSLFGGNKLGTGTTPGFGGFGSTTGLFGVCFPLGGDDS